MSERYKKIFSLEKISYKETSPVVIKAGALVQNSETGRLHIQLKMQNISEKKILLLKAKFFLKDAVNRDLEVVEKQYIDLNANSGEEFAEKTPVLLTEQSTRKFNAIVVEVCFADGEVWSSDENAWEELPSQDELSLKFGPEAIEEYRLLYSEKSKYIPLRHKDVWFCSCGRINKNGSERCADCGSALFEMEKANNETLTSENIYRKGTELIKETTSSQVESGIALLEKIPTWRDVPEILESVKGKAIELKEKEEKTKTQTKKKKKKVAIILSSVLAPLLLFIVLWGTVFAPMIEYKRNWEKGNFGYAVKEKNWTTFAIPNGTTEIIDVAFLGCDNLTSVTIPNSVTSIGSSAFSGCDSLTEIVIPDSVTSIGSSAFSGCDSLTEVVIGNSVTSIGQMAFYNCDSLTEVVIPDSVTSIGDSAFYSCDSLTEVVIPDSVTSIGESAFSVCPIKKATIPTLAITSIPKSSLQKVVITNGKSIGQMAFSNCDSLTEVVIPDSVKSIGEYAFDNCDGLTGVYISDIAKWCNISFGSAESNPLYYAHKLYLNNELVTKLEIPSGVTSIGDRAFYNCDSLTEVVIPDSVTSIGKYAFLGCTRLTDVYYVGTRSQWQKVEGYTNLTGKVIYYVENENDLPNDNGSYWHYVDGVPTKWE